MIVRLVDMYRGDGVEAFIENAKEIGFGRRTGGFSIWREVKVKVRMRMAMKMKMKCRWAPQVSK